MVETSEEEISFEEFQKMLGQLPEDNPTLKPIDEIQKEIQQAILSVTDRDKQELLNLFSK